MKIHTVELRPGAPELHEVVLHSEHLQALARVQAERDEALRMYDAARGNVVRLERWQNNAIEERDTTQAQLAEAVGLLRELRACNSRDSWPVLVETDAFLARHAQAEQQEAREPVLARTEHGVSMDEALDMTMDRYSGAMEKLAAIEQLEREVGPGARNGQIGYKQEAQGAQAGDERAAFEDEFDRRGFELDRLPSGAYLIPAVRFGWEGWQARAALVTQPAVRGAEHE